MKIPNGSLYLDKREKIKGKILTDKQNEAREAVQECLTEYKKSLTDLVAENMKKVIMEEKNGIL